MAENSYFFTAVTGAPTYSATDFVTWLYNTMGRPDGVIRGLDNALAVTVDGAGNAVVNTGCATKTGHGYTNTASLTKTLTLPSAGYKQYTTLVVRVDSSPSPNTMHVVTLAGTAVLIANTATPASITAGTDVYLADVLTTNTAGTYSYVVTDQRVYAPIPAGNTNWATALKTDIGANWASAWVSALGTNWVPALAEALNQAHVPSSSAALSIDSSWNAPLSNTYKQVTAGDYVVPGCGNPLRFDTSGNPLLSYYSGSSAQLYVKVLEIKSPVTGTVRAKYSVSNGYNYQSYIRVYINGTAVGTEHPFTSSTYFHDDISVSMGDLVQLYMYSVTTQIMRVAGFALCCAEEGERYIQ